MTDKTKISKERSLIFSKRFNKWLEYDGWNKLTGKDDLKDVCDELNMTRAEAENLVKENTIAQVFRDALDEILNEILHLRIPKTQSLKWTCRIGINIIFLFHPKQIQTLQVCT